MTGVMTPGFDNTGAIPQRVCRRSGAVVVRGPKTESVRGTCHSGPTPLAEAVRLAPLQSSYEESVGDFCPDFLESHLERMF
jgi:hypothetical protein